MDGTTWTWLGVGGVALVGAGTALLRSRRRASLAAAPDAATRPTSRPSVPAGEPPTAVVAEAAPAPAQRATSAPDQRERATIDSASYAERHRGAWLDERPAAPPSARSGAGGGPVDEAERRLRRRLQGGSDRD